LILLNISLQLPRHVTIMSFLFCFHYVVQSCFKLIILFIFKQFANIYNCLLESAIRINVIHWVLCNRWSQLWSVIPQAILLIVEVEVLDLNCAIGYITIGFILHIILSLDHIHFSYLHLIRGVKFFASKTGSITYWTSFNHTSVIISHWNIIHTILSSIAIISILILFRLFQLCVSTFLYSHRRCIISSILNTNSWVIVVRICWISLAFYIIICVYFLIDIVD